MITLDSSILSHDVKIGLCLQIQTQIYQSACRRLVPSLAGGHQSNFPHPRLPDDFRIGLYILPAPPED